MSITDSIRTTVHSSRRWRGRVQLRGVRVSGEAPTAVLAALGRALSEQPSPEEAAWIERIERHRRRLAASDEALEIVDFGAGRAHRFDIGESQSTNVTVRTLGDMTRSSKPPRWAYLLFRLVRELQPPTVLELGACVGVSACYQAAALELNGRGRLVTLEGAPVLAARAERSIHELGLQSRASVVEGRFGDTLGDVLAELQPVAMAFVDGHHVESATLEYMTRIRAAAADEAVLVFDDIHWSPGMTRAWDQIAADPAFALTIDVGTLGLAVVSRSATGRTSERMSYG